MANKRWLITVIKLKSWNITKFNALSPPPFFLYLWKIDGSKPSLSPESSSQQSLCIYRQNSQESSLPWPVPCSQELMPHTSLFHSPMFPGRILLQPSYFPKSTLENATFIWDNRHTRHDDTPTHLHILLYNLALSLLLSAAKGRVHIYWALALGQRLSYRLLCSVCVCALVCARALCACVVLPRSLSPSPSSSLPLAPSRS